MKQIYIKIASYFLEKYLMYKSNKRSNMILKFQQKFERNMKKAGISLVAMKDPARDGNILLEFVPTLEFDEYQNNNGLGEELSEMLNGKGDGIKCSSI
jgi:hypothetical protein